MKHLSTTDSLARHGRSRGAAVSGCDVPGVCRAGGQEVAHARPHGLPLRAERHRRWTTGRRRRQSGRAPLGELPRITRALAPYGDDVLMLSGLTSDGGRAHGDGPGDHGRAGAAYLTGVHPKKTFGKDIQAGISMDQIAASQLEGRRRFASLELGCEEGIQGGNCDNGYSCAYSNSLSWRTQNTPEPSGDPAARGLRATVRRGRRRKRSGAPSAHGKLPEEHSRPRARRCAESEDVARRRRPAQARRISVRRFATSRSASRRPKRSNAERVPVAAPVGQRARRLRRALTR